MARLKNPNQPPTVTAVRVTQKTKDKLDELHKRWKSSEPYDRTISRALDELEIMRKKVKAQSDDLLSLHFAMNDKSDNIERLLKIQKKQAAEIFKYEHPNVLQEIIV